MCAGLSRIIPLSGGGFAVSDTKNNVVRRLDNDGNVIQSVGGNLFNVVVASILL